MVDKHHQIEPSFSVHQVKDGSGYYVRMAPNVYAPIVRINDFSTEEAAQARIERMTRRRGLLSRPRECETVPVRA
jgi:hypothetical protein